MQNLVLNRYIPGIVRTSPTTSRLGWNSQSKKMSNFMIYANDSNLKSVNILRAFSGIGKNIKYIMSV